MEERFKKGLDYIFILGRGQSVMRCATKKPEKTEYWGCNNVYRVRELDRLFIMHDIYMTQFNRDEKLIENINKKDLPVYTLGKYEVIKNNIQYPMEEVIREFGKVYFLNTASYMLALAIMQRPKSLVLFGIDMFWGTGTEYMRNEKACIEFWLGVATGRGIKIQITKESTVMKRRGYGYFYGFKVKSGKGLHLEPDYMWGRDKCAAKYTIVRKGIEI